MRGANGFAIGKGRNAGGVQGTARVGGRGGDVVDVECWAWGWGTSTAVEVGSSAG